MFSRIDLTVYTVNFNINDNKYKNVKFVKFEDTNLLEFDEIGYNKYIKNDYEKHKYTTLLKTKILNKFSDSYDYYFFVDSDILFTKNSDTLVMSLLISGVPYTLPTKTNLSSSFLILFSDGLNDIIGIVIDLCKLFIKQVIMYFIYINSIFI
jgi:hypothetical protein